MLSLRFGERAMPLAWRVEATDGAIGFDCQKALLAATAVRNPPGIWASRNASGAKKGGPYLVIPPIIHMSRSANK